MTETLATVLWLCANPTWAGCGIVQEIQYSSEEACRTALSGLVVTGNGGNVVGGDGKQVIAICRPPKVK
jgi:hypothetical protein